MTDDLLRDPLAATTAREAAEAAGDDRMLLALRELEVARAGLPEVIDGARRARMLAADAISTTWEGWRQSDGCRLLLRLLRPRWRRDPVMLRRLGRGARETPLGLSAATYHDNDWPCLVIEAPGPLVADRLPVEDPPDTTVLAGLLGGGLEGLRCLHGAGRVHGGPIATHLCEPVGGGPAVLVWLDRFAASGTAADDLRDLGAVVAALDPTSSDPVGALAAGWAQSPPPSAEVGLSLLHQVLAHSLLSERHAIAMAARNATRRARVARLGRAVRALTEALPPPVGRWCLAVGTDGMLAMVHSDGQLMRGGAASDVGSALPVVGRPPLDFDAQSARWLLRSWALRTQGDEARRAEIQAELGSDDVGASAIVRWMAAMARLRAARLLLAVGQAHPMSDR